MVWRAEANVVADSFDQAVLYADVGRDGLVGVHDGAILEYDVHIFLPPFDT